jgi:hypothetical protein
MIEKNKSIDLEKKEIEYILNIFKKLQFSIGASQEMILSEKIMEKLIKLYKE